MRLTLSREGLYNLANIVCELGCERPEFLPNIHKGQRDETARAICRALESRTDGECVLVVE